MDEKAKAAFPSKDIEKYIQSDIAYTKELHRVIEWNETIVRIFGVREKYNLTQKRVADNEEHISTDKSHDPSAVFSHILYMRYSENLDKAISHPKFMSAKVE
ncbi:hypothetical protein PH235_10275 [Trichococcus sp. K1Tr]|nr:hypothetical protein [Trichococcus sp. K1Tr]